jgi:hypothetical protein
LIVDNNNNIKNTTITENTAKYDNERYCFEDPYSERRINLITEGLEPRYTNRLGNLLKENALAIVDINIIKTLFFGHLNKPLSFDIISV